MSVSEAAADWAGSGIVALTGHPTGPPLVPPGRAATRANELGALFGVDGAALLGERAALTGHRRAGTTSAGGSCRLLPLTTGWAAVSCARPDDPALLGALVGRPLDDDDPWPALAEALRTLSPAEVDERAALLGVAAGAVADPPAAAAPAERPRTAGSVQDALVVSFGALWAAPLCAHLLATRGARVITVETPHRPDPSRWSQPAFHNLLHEHDRSVVLDPDVPDDRAALQALVRAADIVIEASRPRALRGFGLDLEAELARGATWVSITAAGRESPRIGFGDDVAATAGLVARDDTGRPVFVGDAIADPLTGLTAAALALTRPGRLHDVSMTGVVAGTLDGTPGGDAGGLPIAAPRARRAGRTAPGPGADTGAVLAGLGIRR